MRLLAVEKGGFYQLNKNFAGIILESPFTSMIDAGKTKYPYLPVRFLLKDKYESKYYSSKRLYDKFYR